MLPFRPLQVQAYATMQPQKPPDRFGTGKRLQFAASKRPTGANLAFAFFLACYCICPAIHRNLLVFDRTIQLMMAIAGKTHKMPLTRK